MLTGSGSLPDKLALRGLAQLAPYSEGQKEKSELKENDTLFWNEV